MAKIRMREVSREEFIMGMTPEQVAKMDAIVEADTLETIEAINRGEIIRGVHITPDERVAIIRENNPRATAVVAGMTGRISETKKV